MNEQKKIDFAQLDQEIATMEKAIATFSSYGSHYLVQINDSLSGFNSDFVDQLQKVLTNMEDTTAPALQKELADYQTDLQLVKAAFQQMDDQQAQEMEGK